MARHSLGGQCDGAGGTEPHGEPGYNHTASLPKPWLHSPAARQGREGLGAAQELHRCQRGRGGLQGVVGGQQRCCPSAQCPSPLSAGQGIAAGRREHLLPRGCMKQGRATWMVSYPGAGAEHRGLPMEQHQHQAVGQSCESDGSPAPAPALCRAPTPPCGRQDPALALAAAAPSSSLTHRHRDVTSALACPQPCVCAHPRHCNAAPAGEGAHWGACAGYPGCCVQLRGPQRKGL